LLFDATDSDPSAGANVFQPVHGTQSRVGSGADSPLAGVGIYYVGTIMSSVSLSVCHLSVTFVICDKPVRHSVIVTIND